MGEYDRLQGVVLGTAGHVDHGKTTLIRGLTGMETDRLAEETRRGISIELGFAWLDDPQVGRVAFVDVPGHERFVRQMIAGAAGLDGVLLVVASDEGMMPQTREHLDICHLLGVQDGLVVLTKRDLVDEDWFELVRDDVERELVGTFLEGATPVACCSTEPDSLEAVQAGLVALCERVSGQRRLQLSRLEDRPFKLSVDRVFSMKGFGTVITGTSQAGRVAVGASLRVEPGGSVAKVRGLQVHTEQRGEAGPGRRLAINLQGTERDGLDRGAVLTGEGGVFVGSMFDGWMSLRPHMSEVPNSGTRAMLHVGTAQVEATLSWVEAPEFDGMTGRFAPGLVQLRTDEPIPVMPGERFVLRGSGANPSHGRTLGGGVLLTAADRRHRVGDTGRATLLRSLMEGTDADRVQGVVARAGEQGRPREALISRLSLGRSEIEAAIALLLNEGALIEAGSDLLVREAAEALSERVTEVLETHHSRHPARAGLSAEELRTRVRASLGPALFADLLLWMEREGKVRVQGGVVALASFSPRRTPAQEQACEALTRALVDGGCAPPRIKDLPGVLDLGSGVVEDAMHLLLADGSATRVSQELLYDSSLLIHLKHRLTEHLEAHGTIDAGAFKALTGASRKWSIPLLEYFDKTRLTLRQGDRRVLRKRG